MKYFTFDWWMNWQSCRAEIERPFAAYSRHLDELRDRLPAACLEIAPIERLHDARVCSLEMRDDASLVMRLRTAEEDGSSRDLTMSYLQVLRLDWTSDVESGEPDLEELGDLGYHEFDVDKDGVFLHRVLFAAGWELCIWFKELDVSEG